MAGGRIVTICQFGGEFVTNSDGSMSYDGGDAKAMEINREMKFSEFKSELSSMFDSSTDGFTIKYFLPNNKKTLITVSNDNDLKRMVDFNADSATTDVYVLKKNRNRTIIRSAPADSGTSTDGNTAVVAPRRGAKRLRLSTTGQEGLITGVGQVFDGPKPFRDALQKYGATNNFSFKFIKNDAASVIAECSVEGCSWRIQASRSAKKEFTIKKMNDTHTCGRVISKEGHRLASQQWVANIIKDKLRDSPDYKPREILNDLQREYGLNLNYAQAWRGRSIAEKELNNSHKEACDQLNWFCNRIMETNPGSVAVLQTTGDMRFHVFVAFHASLGGFEHGCRPLIFLDAIPLKANKQWKLLVATAVDGENNIFPVSFSVAEAETNDNWLWFLVQLKSAFSMSRTITFVSNKQNGLEEAVAQVFEDSYHGYCVHQLIENFKAELDESWTQEVKDVLVHTFERCVFACKVEEFNECVTSIKAESQELSEWVLASKPEIWSNAYFKGHRFGHYYSNAADTFNNWISMRYEPSLVQIVDVIRCKMMEMMYSRRESSNTWTEALTPSVNRRMEEEMVKAQALNVVCTSGSVFEVQDDSINVVNIETWECTCRRWQVFGLPCMHALAVIERTDGCVYDFCSKYFLTEYFRSTYALSINPIPDAGWPGCGDPVHSPVSCPPRTRRMVGRPKVKPATPRVSIKRSNRCGRCKSFGHNKQTCKSPA